MRYKRNIVVRFIALAVALAVIPTAYATRRPPQPLPAPGVHKKVTVLPSGVVCHGVDGGTRLVCWPRGTMAARAQARRDMRTAATRR